MSWPPTDSADARELRERELEDQAAADEQARAGAAAEEVHTARCDAGWLGEDDAGRPIPCPQCRPHLGRCPTCGAPLLVRDDSTTYRAHLSWCRWSTRRPRPPVVVLNPTPRVEPATPAELAEAARLERRRARDEGVVE